MSRSILVGLVSGLAVGLFFGERVAFLDWPAKAFVQLLGVTVLPYLLTSLVTGIAHGTADEAKRLASKGGLAILMLWVLTLALVFLSPLALPPDKGGFFYANNTVTNEAPIDWIDLYIPANPFRALSNNFVPAVVVFAALLGMALLGLAEKERVLAPLRLVNDTLSRAGNLVVKLTPIGIFAIAGHAAGTLRIEEFERLEAFLVLSIGLFLLLTFWILPGLTSALTGVPYRRILSLTWDPLITSFVTANLFIVLPQLQRRGRQILAEAHISRQVAGEAVDVLIPTSFTFPHSAKLVALSFIVFAGWYVGAPVAVSKFPALAGVGLLSLFGNLNTAIPFLLNLVRLPADLFQLFLISSVVNSRFGSAAAAMHTFALAVIGAHFMVGGTRIVKRRLATFAVGTVVVVGSFLLGSRLVLGAVLPGPESATATFDRLHLSGVWGRLAQIEPATDPARRHEPPPVAGLRLDEIQKRGVLRVCVSPDAMPWCFVNGRGEIVGFDVEVAHALAVTMDTRLMLVPVKRWEWAQSLAGTCDVVTGRTVPSQGGGMMAYSRPMTHETWAFLTLDYRRDDFASLDRVRELRAPRIAVFRLEEWVRRVKAQLPNADVTAVDSISQFMSAPPGQFDAMLTGLDRASAYSLVAPQFTAVVPTPDLGSVPIALDVAKGEQPLLDYVNAFVDVYSSNGFFQDRLDYWVQGKGAQAERGPRWSVGRNVLHWWK